MSRSRFIFLLAPLGAAAIGACGGVDTLPPPPPPPPAMPAAPTAITKDVDAGAEAPPEAPVLLLAGAAAPEPTTASVLHVLAPSRGQLVESSKAEELLVRVEVKGWAVSPSGGRVHLVLDGRLARTVSDLKAPLKLGDLAGGPLGEGHHVLVAVLARGSGETLKSKDALVVTEFYVGHKTAPSVDLKKPFLVLFKPDGTYEDESAEHVLVDFAAVGASLADDSDRIALRLEGPGITVPLTATTTRVVPHYLENLHAGTYALKLEILGKDQKPLANSWATVTRSITVKRTPHGDELRKAARAAEADAGATKAPTSDAGTSSDEDASAPSSRDAGPPKLRPPPLKPKPTLEKPKPPEPPLKKR